MTLIWIYFKLNIPLSDNMTFVHHEPISEIKELKKNKTT